MGETTSAESEYRNLYFSLQKEKEEEAEEDAKIANCIQ